MSADDTSIEHDECEFIVEEPGLERRRAMLILEVLAGIKGAGAAAEELGIALAGYYQLEDRAVKGLVEACRPKVPGPRRDYAREVEELTEERDRLKAENARYQALVRASQVTVGLDPDKPRKVKRRNRRPSVRALRAIDQLESKPGSR